MVIVKAPVPLDVRARVKLRDGNRCVACHATKRLTIDHIVPRCRGGGNNEENLQLLCEYCNGAKADSVIDFRSMCREQREEWVKNEGSAALRRRAERKAEEAALAATLESVPDPPPSPAKRRKERRRKLAETHRKPWDREPGAPYAPNSLYEYDFKTDRLVPKKTLTKAS